MEDLFTIRGNIEAGTSQSVILDPQAASGRIACDDRPVENLIRPSFANKWMCTPYLVGSGWYCS
jgi:hypothetical protein